MYELVCLIHITRMSKKHGREHDSVVVEPEVVKSDVAKREEEMLAFWREHDIFTKSVQAPAGENPKGDYVFYDGPPFATGLPHYGHLLASTIKDAVPRFWTMQGYRVRRTWGWDCHGLPLENLIEKELGLATKRDIEEFGIQNFNEKARSAVMRYADEWRRIIPRFGRFVDMDDDYKTMDSSYTESVWWVFQSLHKKGLVYEGFKSMHLCPRCGTTLSNFEVNLGYKDIKDIAVTVKLPLLDEAGTPTDTSLLVWTTTPWTLPGNLAAAVHEEYTYVKVRVLEPAVDEFVVLAKERVGQLGTDAYEVVEEFSGADLVGRRYQPPFPYLPEQDMEGKDQAWTIYHADYVELGEDGTGAVHLAPAYGEDDMELAKIHGVPIFHHVAEDGRFKDFVTPFAGQLVKPKDDAEAEVTHLEADIEVVKALQANDRLFKKENITHSYPHCWRCDTPLLNYATTSWFVEVTKIKEQLLAQNDAIHWVPENVGKNRFGKWLEGARDWAVSRQRYWGAPLPVWRDPVSGAHHILGSLAELQQYVPVSGNHYYIMRHTEAESNLTGEINADSARSNPLTEKGVAQAKAAADDLRTEKIDMIVHSGMERTQQTAQLLAAELGLPDSAVVSDDRLVELQTGAALEGKSWSEYAKLFASEQERFTISITGVENRIDVQRRAGACLYDWEQKVQQKRILFISHASTSFALECAAAGLDVEAAMAKKATEGFLQNGEWRALSFTPMPHNDAYALDFHRPYIDQIDLYHEGVKLERVPDVFDCWFESGSMPYGQHHYPFECDEATFLQEHYPANFIAEGLDQTRGWFYSLLVLGTALFGKSPYENVIVNGLTLAEDGKKMSKSLQNYPDPMELADRLGVDTIRYYLLSSSIMRAEDLNFSEKEATELQRKNIGRLHNVVALYQMYAQDVPAHSASQAVLDQWILARLAELIKETTAGYKNYELDRATRPLTDFIDDLSVWYVRRSRDRLKGGERVDTDQALATMRYVLRELAKVMAPAMPFYAEYLYQAMRTSTEPESVHLTAWPESPEVAAEVLAEMQAVREVVRKALELRVNAGIKVRQPLPSVTVRRASPWRPDYAAIVADELNVKAVQHDPDQDEPVRLDTTITPELAREGQVRELTRAIQGARKQAGLDPHDQIALLVDKATQTLLDAAPTMVQETVGAASITAVAVTERTGWVEVPLADTIYRFTFDPLV